MQTGLCSAMTKSLGNATIKNTDAAASLIVDGAIDRCSLVFCPAAADYYVSPLNSVALGSGIPVITALGRPVVISLAKHGGLVRMPWYVTSPGGPQTVLVLEGQSTAEG